jgi:hypothetical protein
MAKQRSAVSVFCRVPNVGSTCDAGGSSSLHTRMNAAARLMQPLQCAATHLKTSPRLLQHASNTQRTQALAQQAQRTAQHARRCSRTCTFFTRPRVKRSITTSAQLHVMFAMCISAGAVASRWHANATPQSMRRTGTKGGYSAKKKPKPRGCSASCRRCFQRGDRCEKNHATAFMISSRRLVCARSSASDSSLPSATRASDTRLPVRRLGNERRLDDIDSGGLGGGCDLGFSFKRAILPGALCHTSVAVHLIEEGP